MTDAQIGLVLDALLVLVAWALREGYQPLVTLRMQLFLSMVGSRLMG